MPKAIPVERNDGTVYGYAVKCPGCGHPHVFNVAIPGEDNRPGRPCWTFNGDVERPTFSPSMLVFHEQGGVRRVLCHSFVTDGRIKFLDDTTQHSLRGDHPLPEFEW